MLHNPPALISVYDFEWLSIEAIIDNFENWLSPSLQQVKLFPFAQNGAGDIYCLAPAKDDTHIALAGHDTGEVEVIASSLDNFIYASLIETIGNFSHLIDNNFSEQEAHQCLLADIKNMMPYLPKFYRHQLSLFIDKPVISRAIKHGEYEKSVLSLFTEEEEAKAFSIIARNTLPDILSIKCRWEIE